MKANPSAPHVLIVPSVPYRRACEGLQGIFQRHQAEALVRAGVQVGVLSPPELQSLRRLGSWRPGLYQRSITNEGAIGVMRQAGWSWIPGVLPGSLDCWRWRWRRGFSAYCDRYGRPDVLHAHSARIAGVMSQRLSRLTGIPYVITEHDTTYARGHVGGREALRLREVFAQASCRIVVSPQLGKVLERIVGPEVLPYRCIPNVLDALFEAGGEAAARAPIDPPTLFSAGSLEPKKGFDVLLRAFAEAFPPPSGVRLRIAGAGQKKDDLVALASDLGLGPRVEWLGLLSREQMLREMQDCRCFTLASRVETFGVVVIEALACGRPVVATASGGPESILSPGDGFVVPVENVAALAGALQAVLRSPAAWGAEAIRRRCLGRYGRVAVAGQLIEVYGEVIARLRSSTTEWSTST